MGKEIQRSEDRDGIARRVLGAIQRHPWFLLVIAVVYWFVPEPTDALMILGVITGLLDEILLSAVAVINALLALKRAIAGVRIRRRRSSRRSK